MFSPFDPRLLDAIERLTIDNWAGIVWRVTMGDTDVLRTNIRGSRWNPPGVEVLYCSLDRDAAVAEVEYLLARQPIKVTAPRKVSCIEVKLSRVVNLSTDAAIRAMGHEADQIRSDDHAIPQRIGAAIEWLQIPGCLVPSLRYDATNLVIYYKGLLPPADRVEVIESGE